MDFKDKVVLVTGSAQGIGQTTALAFAAQGARVALTDVNESLLNRTAAEVEGTGADCLALRADVSIRAEVEEAFGRVEEKFGRLDALVNNAGITRDALLLKMTEDQWRRVIDVNLTGVFLCLQAGARIMSQGQGGSIINISSAARFGNIGQANYSAAKAGLVGLTRTAARELARKNIRVNAISPGPINTEMLQAVPEKALEKILSKIPLGRAGAVEELAELILFLASARSSYITGQVINCDGGWFMT
ncbi:MAG: 3-oxoacyl-ACP reductase FabG [Deltaproteobacteria bacterium]|nr:3-oxoacyl-ACP reductase FabG [Deltaproteobacteria bacterium]